MAPIAQMTATEATKLYRKLNADAIKLLKAAKAFVEDGDQLDACRCATDAMSMLFRAWNVKNTELLPGRSRRD